MKLPLALKVVFALFFAVHTHATVHAEEHKSLSVGVVLSLTGMASIHGKAILDGVELAKSDLEKKGWKIDLQLEDDGTEPKRTVTAFQRLTGAGQRLFVGPTWGILAEPARPVIMRSNSLSLQPCNSSDFVAGDNSRNFFFFTPPTSALPLINEFLKKYPNKKVAILNNTSNWGDLWTKLFTKAATDNGLSVASTDMVQFSEGVSTFASLLAKYKRDGVEVILSTTTKESTAEIVKKMEELQYNGTLLSPDLLDSISDKLVGGTSRFVEGYGIHPVTSTAFIESYQKTFGRVPGKYADSGYDALTALAAAVSAVGNDPDAIKEYLENKIDIEGAAGRVKFDKNHDVAGRGYEVAQLVKKS
jgi:branched-chain amino acid transport system substrate-binding protein